MKRLLFVPLALSVTLPLACRDENPASDVRGNYDLTFDDRLTLKLDVGGVVHEAEGSESETVTFDVNGQPFTLDLAAFCGREDVACPSETLWTKVSVDQPEIAASNPNTHVLHVVNNTVRELPAGRKAEQIAGLIDDQDRFGLLIAADAQGEGDCGLLGISTVGGRFTHEGESTEACTPPASDAGMNDAGAADAGASDDVPAGAPCVRVTWPEGAAVTGIADGEVKLGFLGACAFGPALVGATLEIKTGFTGVRTGPFDPPPFVPREDGSDGGVPDASDASDAGLVDAGG